MKKVLIIIALSATVCSGNAQVMFEKIYKEDAAAQPAGTMMGSGSGAIVHNKGSFVLQTADGGFFMAGNETDPNTLESNVVLIRTDASGITAWTKKFGGYGDDFSRSAVQTADGGFLITGGTNSVGAGGMDVQLIRIDSTGTELWTKTYGGEGDEEGASLKQTSDGGFIIAGRTNSSGAGNEDVYLVKTNANGDLLWSKTYGGPAVDIAYSVLETADNGFAITGKTQSFGAGNWDVYMIRTDASGNEVWARAIGGNGADMGQSAVQTEEGELIVAGSTSNYGDTDVYLIKLTASGTTIWTKSFGGINADMANSVDITSDGGYIIAGETQSFGTGSSDAYLIKTGSGGSTEWTKTYGATGADAAMFSTQTAGGAYVTIGTYQHEDASEGFYLVRTNDLGNTECNESTTATIITTVTSTLTTVTSTVLAGQSPVSGTIASGMDANTIIIADIHCSSEPEENPMTTGDGFSTSLDMVQEYTAVAKSAINDTESIAVNVYPNPSAGVFYFSGLSNGGNIKIYTVAGVLIFEQNVSDAVEKVDLTGQAKGFYFYRVTSTDGKVQQAKILVQ